MARLLEALKERGIEITEDVEKAVMAEFVEKKEVDLKDSELGTLREQLKTRDADIETLKAAEGGKVTKEAFDELQAKYNQEKTDLTAKLSEQKLDGELKLALSKANTKDVGLLLGLIDKAKVKVSEDGKLLGLAEQLAGIQKEKAFLFNETKPNDVTKPGAYSYVPESSVDKPAAGTISIKDAIAEALGA